MRAPLFLLFLMSVACTGPMHQKGDQRLGIVVNHSTATPRSYPGFGTALGTADSAGVTASFEHFIDHGIAAMGSIGYQRYDQTDGISHAAEANIGLRMFLFSRERIAGSLDFSGGYMVGSLSVPETGTHGNFLFGFGPTLEFRLSERVNLMVGYQFRHLSNGKGSKVPQNPAQNDHRILGGVVIRW